jgi:hypothetical protein
MPTATVARAFAWSDRVFDSAAATAVHDTRRRCT